MLPRDDEGGGGGGGWLDESIGIRWLLGTLLRDRSWDDDNPGGWWDGSDGGGIWWGTCCQLYGSITDISHQKYL